MAKQKRLVEQGVEPNTGPNASRRNQEFDFQICTLNTQGVPGAWRALEHYGDTAKVLLLQDTPFTENEFVAFQRSAKRKHYRTYWQPGKVHPSGRRTGGVTTLVPSSLSQQPVAPPQDLQAVVYLMITHIHDYAVLNFYASPGCGKDMAELLTATFISHKLGGYPWVAAGDANEEPNHHIAASFTQFEGHVFSSGLATHFKGKKELDWFSTSRPQNCGQVTVHNSIKISDHKLVAMRVRTSTQPATRFRYPEHPRWNKPSFLTPEQWQSLLQVAWQKNAEQPSPNLLYLRPTDVDVNLEWVNFMHLLNDTYKNATMIAADRTSDPAETAEVQSTLKQNGFKTGKGIQCPKVQKVSNSLHVAGHHRPDMADRPDYVNLIV